MMRVSRVTAVVVVLCVASASACGDPDNGGGAIQIGDTIQGEVSGDDRAMPSMTWAPVTDAGTPEPQDATYEGDVNGDTFTLELAAGDSVQVVMCAGADSSVLDPYLIVDFGGQRILADDDSAGDVNARVQIDATTAGTYSIVATVISQTVAYMGERGYTLHVARTPADGEPAIGCE